MAAAPKAATPPQWETLEPPRELIVRPPPSASPAVAASDSTPRVPPRAARSVPQAAPAPAPGRLFVNATPWGQLSIDGQPVGNTPKANLTIAAGVHRLRVERDGYEAFEREIRVGSGDTVRLTNIVLTPRRQ